MPVRFSTRCPNTDYLGFEASPEAIVTAAKKAEEVGFDAIFVNDHIIVDGSPRAASWTNVWDPFVAMSFIAAHTMARFGPLGLGPLKDVVFQDQWGKPYRGFNRTESCRLSGLAGTDSSKSGFLQRRVGRTSPIRPAAPAIEIEFAGKARVRIRTSSLPATAFELSSGPFTVKQKKLATARLHEALGTTPRQLSADPMRTDRRSGGRCRTRKGTRSDLVRCHRDPLNRAAA